MAGVAGVAGVQPQFGFNFNLSGLRLAGVSGEFFHAEVAVVVAAVELA